MIDPFEPYVVTNVFLTRLMASIPNWVTLQSENLREIASFLRTKFVNLLFRAWPPWPDQILHHTIQVELQADKPRNIASLEERYMYEAARPARMSLLVTFIDRPILVICSDPS